MSKHEYERDGIIYIFPDDDSYRMFEQGEASLDKRGRLIHTKKKHLIRILEHKSAPKQTPPIYTRNPNTSSPSTENSFKEEMKNSLKSGIKSSVRKKSKQVTDDFLDWAFYTAIPTGFRKIKSKANEIWDNAHSEPKASKVIKANHDSSTTEVIVKPETKQQVQTPMTDEEAEAEIKSFVSHYIEMIKILLRLRDAGRLEELQNLLPQLTSQTNIDRFNSTLSDNPNLLAMSQSNQLSKILGRDLFQGGEFVPIEVNEIIELATVNDQEDI